MFVIHRQYDCIINCVFIMPTTFAFFSSTLNFDTGDRRNISMIVVREPF